MTTRLPKHFKVCLLYLVFPFSSNSSLYFFFIVLNLYLARYFETLMPASSSWTVIFAARFRDCLLNWSLVLLIIVNLAEFYFYHPSKYGPKTHKYSISCKAVHVILLRWRKCFALFEIFQLQYHNLSSSYMKITH